MHCLSTIAKLNRQADQADKPNATHRIKALRDKYNRIAADPNCPLSEVGIFRDFANSLELLISRIERDEEVAS